MFGELRAARLEDEPEAPTEDGWCSEAAGRLFHGAVLMSGLLVLMLVTSVVAKSAEQSGDMDSPTRLMGLPYLPISWGGFGGQCRDMECLGLVSFWVL